MHYSAIILCLLPAALALPSIAPRKDSKAAELLETMQQLGTEVTALTTATNAFDGTFLNFIPQTLAIAAADAKLDLTVVQAASIAHHSANFTAPDSMEIVQSLTVQVDPINAALDALKQKQPLFKSEPLEAPFVLADLKNLKGHIDKLVNTLYKRITVDQEDVLNFGAGILDKAFDATIAAYTGQ